MSHFPSTSFEVERRQTQLFKHFPSSFEPLSLCVNGGEPHSVLQWEAAVSLTEPRVTWELKDSTEGAPRSDLPVDMSVGGCLDCSLM